MRCRKGTWAVLAAVVGAALAALLVAPAFACTGAGGLLYTWPTKGPPGTPVTVEGTRLDPGARADVYWNGQFVKAATADAEGVFTTDIVVPDDVVFRPGRDVANYQITAQQTRSDGTRTPPATITFEVTRPAASPGGPDPTSPPPTDPVPTTSPGPRPSTGPAGTTVPTPTAPRPGAAPGTPAPGASAPPAESVAAPAGGAPGGAVAAPPSPATPSAASAGPEGTVAGTDRPSSTPSAVPFPEDVWSGLDAQQVPSLLAEPAPSKGSPAPLGWVLLGGGVVVGALAVVAGRRRTALARRASWR